MQKIIRETSGKTMGDANGWKRGEKGYGKDSVSSKFATPNFDRSKLYGPKADDGNVGNFPSGKKLPQGKGYEGID